MTLSNDEKNRIMATKPPSFTMKGLRPMANLLARYTSPSQICSVLKEFGIKEEASSPVDAEAVLLHAFETLREENNDEDVRKIIEKLLTLYGQLIDEKRHDKGLVGPVREILQRGHFNLGFHIVKKEYVIVPFEGPAHGIVMRVEGTSEVDFQDAKKRKVRTLSSPQLDPANFYIVKDGDDFKYRGVLLDKLGKDTDYFKVFDALYALLPTGGMTTYKDIGKETATRITKTRNLSARKMAKFIQDKLGVHNGFLHHAKGVSNSLPGGKELIHIVRGEGIEFNNRKGT